MEVRWRSSACQHGRERQLRWLQRCWPRTLCAPSCATGTGRRKRRCSARRRRCARSWLGTCECEEVTHCGGVAVRCHLPLHRLQLYGHASAHLLAFMEPALLRSCSSCVRVLLALQAQDKEQGSVTPRVTRRCARTAPKCASTWASWSGATADGRTRCGTLSARARSSQGEAQPCVSACTEDASCYGAVDSVACRAWLTVGCYQ